MRRSLLQNVKASPYTSGDAIDRAGFLSAVIAVIAAAAGTLTFTVTHCDTIDGTYEAVSDPRLEVSDPPVQITGGVITIDDVAEGDDINADLDLIGCKQFIKVTLGGAAGTDAACAYVLGDPQNAPV